MGARQWENALKYLPEWPARSNSRGGRGPPGTAGSVVGHCEGMAVRSCQIRGGTVLYAPSILRDRGRFCIDREERSHAE